MAQDAQWCSLQEAARRTGVNESEVKSLAYRGELFTAIYSPKKRYLVFTRAEGGGVTGHATCEYFGPLAVPKTITNTLLGGESTNLNGMGGRALDARGLSNWQGTCPFSSEDAGNLVGWRALDVPESSSGPLLMTPMPTEYQGGVACRKIRDGRPGGIEATELTAAIDKLIDKIVPNDYNLDYRTNGAIGPDALIFHTLVKAGGVEQGENSADARSEGLKLSPPGKRADDMAWLLWRVIQAHPELSAKEIWSLLRNEIDTGEPEYDIDCILREVRGDEIRWCSTKGKEKKLGGRAFENRISRLRTSDKVETSA